MYLAKKLGKKSVLGKLQALKVFNKKNNTEMYDKANNDYKFIVKHAE